MATLSVPRELSSPGEDAKDLHKAFKGFGCDTAKVVSILAHRDATQRSMIQQEYRAKYSQELINRMSSELSGNLRRALLLWMPDPATRDADVLRQALNGETIDLLAVTEVICSRTPTQLQAIKQIYLARYSAYLEHGIHHGATGDHQKLLLAYLSTPRYEGPEVDDMMATNDAKDLYRAGEKRLGTDEKTFIRIFSERSRAHLAGVASYYRNAYGKTLEKATKNETSGHFGRALLAILRCAENPGLYFAKELRKAMKGLGTNDTTLTRIIVTRTEMDMQQIKAEYHRKYNKHLHDAIHSETSGQYRTFLISLVGENGANYQLS